MPVLEHVAMRTGLNNAYDTCDEVTEKKQCYGGWLSLVLICVESEISNRK